MLKRILLFVVIGALFFIAIQFASVFFYAWEFEDFVRDEVKYTPTRESDANDHLVEHIVEEGHFYSLELAPSDVTVQKSTDSHSGITTLEVDASYTSPVDLYYFTYPIRRVVRAVTKY